VRDINVDYVAVARFRVALRAFESAAEEAARAAGLTLQRYLLLLMIKGASNGLERATINELAAQLKLEPHTITGAASRAEEAGLLVRERCDDDRRRTWLRLTPEGERRLAQVVVALQSQRETLLEAIDAIAAGARAIGAPAKRAPQARPR
jgi:DNA-binding MarR family transcriptional regulator